MMYGFDHLSSFIKAEDDFLFLVISETSYFFLDGHELKLGLPKASITATNYILMLTMDRRF